MKKDEGSNNIIKSFPWDRIIDRIVSVLRCSSEDLGKQVGVTRQAIDGYHANDFFPKEETALALLLIYVKICEPAEGQEDLLILEGLSESESRLIKQIASEMKKKQRQLDAVKKQKAEAESERRKAEIELIKKESYKS